MNEKEAKKIAKELMAKGMTPRKALIFLIKEGLSTIEIMRGISKVRGISNKEFDELLLRCGGDIKTLCDYLDLKRKRS